MKNKQRNKLIFFNLILRNRRRTRGFTLIEIMVAIAILGTLGVVMISSASRSSTDIAAMQDKLEALSIADYALNLALLQGNDLEKGTEEEVISRSSREWLVNVTVSETPNSKVLRVDALVKPYQTVGTPNEQSTVLLSGFHTDLEP